jgi:multicomponent Na+:H+ antiporter subunit C
MLELLGHGNSWTAIVLMMAGLYMTLASRHMIRKLIGLGMFQTSVLLLYISAGWIHGAAAPILKDGSYSYVNPLPQVLMLTAIVVGVATLAVGLALVVRIHRAYGTVDEDRVIALDQADLASQREEMPSHD